MSVVPSILLQSVALNGRGLMVAAYALMHCICGYQFSHCHINVDNQKLVFSASARTFSQILLANICHMKTINHPCCLSSSMLLHVAVNCVD
jgi:hypothetical protein